MLGGQQSLDQCGQTDTSFEPSAYPDKLWVFNLKTHGSGFTPLKTLDDSCRAASPPPLCVHEGQGLKNQGNKIDEMYGHVMATVGNRRNIVVVFGGVCKYNVVLKKENNGGSSVWGHL